MPSATVRKRELEQGPRPISTLSRGVKGQAGIGMSDTGSVKEYRNHKYRVDRILCQKSRTRLSRR